MTRLLYGIYLPGYCMVVTRLLPGVLPGYCMVVTVWYLPDE